MSYRLNVPYREKDDAKSKGARWNYIEKYWYCIELTDALRRWYEGEEEPQRSTQPAGTAVDIAVAGSVAVNNANDPYAAYKTVSEVNKMITESFNATVCFKTILVKGEVTDYRGPNSNGHHFFSIKDEKNALPCKMWKSVADRALRFELKDGKKVAITGTFEFWDQGGTASLNVKRIEDIGAGEINLKLLELKAKLEEEGLFAPEHKKDIPKFPKTIGIVTSKDGQARRDIEKVALKRNPYVQLLLYHANVQGEGACKTIREGIKALDQMGLDTIIVGRGGGSEEDLMAFNDEAIARAVYAAVTPIISAVGHEGNWTLIDLVADKRAATPSEAAEEAVPDIMTIIKQVKQLGKNISDNMRNSLESRKLRLNTQEAKLKGNDPVRKLKEKRDRLDNLSQILAQKIQRVFETKKNRLNVLSARLEGLSPTAKLVNGFGYISVHDKPVISISQVKGEDILDIRIHDGHIIAKVIETVSE